jgi:hypothetical protein
MVPSEKTAKVVWLAAASAIGFTQEYVDPETEQEAAPGHVFEQLPQFAGLVMSVSQPSPALLEQWAQPAAQVSDGKVQTPALQVAVLVTWRFVQSCPHVPQLALSFGTQRPLQRSWPGQEPASDAPSGECPSTLDWSAEPPSAGDASPPSCAAASEIVASEEDEPPSSPEPVSDAIASGPPSCVLEAASLASSPPPPPEPVELHAKRATDAAPMAPSKAHRR